LHFSASFCKQNYRGGGVTRTAKGSRREVLLLFGAAWLSRQASARRLGLGAKLQFYSRLLAAATVLGCGLSRASGREKPILKIAPSIKARLKSALQLREVRFPRNQLETNLVVLSV